MTETNTKKTTLSRLAQADLEYAAQLARDLAAARRMLQGIYAPGSPVLPREVFDACLSDWLMKDEQRDVAAKVVRQRIVYLRSALARLPFEVAGPDRAKYDPVTEHVSASTWGATWGDEGGQSDES